MTPEALQSQASTRAPAASDHLIAALFFCTGLLLYGAPLALAPAAVLIGVSVLLVTLLARPSTALADFRGIAAFLPLLALLTASAGWAIDGGAALSLALRLGALFIAGMALVCGSRILPLGRLRPMILALAVGLAMASLVAAIDLHLGNPLGRLLHPSRVSLNPGVFYERGATVHAILVLPLLIGLWRSHARRLAIIHTALAAICILSMPSLAAKVALAVAAIGFAAIHLAPSLRWALLAGIVVGAVALPFVLPITLDRPTTCWLANHKSSALHRIYIWNFAGERIRERPLAGWGLDAARRIPGGDAFIRIQQCDAAGQPVGAEIPGQLMPLHPHNAILQLWLELGAAGVIFGVGAVIYCFASSFRRAAWQPRPAQAVIAGTMAAALSVGLVSFGLWQEWFLGGLFLAAAITVYAARHSGVAEPS